MRGAAPTNPPHPQFRCLVCKVFVRGTESGHCPRCGKPAPVVDLAT